MTTEEQKLCKAADDFNEAIKERLLQKAREGYTGWDGDYPAAHLAAEIRQDTRTSDNGKSKAVDIGARAMMLWFRKESTEGNRT
jgi:hypothetical protein